MLCLSPQRWGNCGEGARKALLDRRESSDAAQRALESISSPHFNILEMAAIWHFLNLDSFRNGLPSWACRGCHPKSSHLIAIFSLPFARFFKFHHFTSNLCLATFRSPSIFFTAVIQPSSNLLMSISCTSAWYSMQSFSSAFFFLSGI